MRYALSGSLTALSFSLTNALKVDQFEGCATVVTHTHYVYATIEPSAFYSAGGSGSPAPGSSDAKNPSGDSASEGSFGYATADAYYTVHPSVSSDCSDSTTVSSSKATVSPGASAATGYRSSYGVGVSTSTGFSTVVVSTPASSYATAVSSSTPCSSATGIFTPVTRSWSSYSASFANTSTSAYPTGASYPAGVSYSAGVSPSTKIYSASMFSHANVSTSAISTSSGMPSGMPSAPATVSSTDSSVVSSTDSSVISSTDSSILPFTDSSVVPSMTSLATSSLATSTLPATTTGTYGPNVIPGGHFDGEAAPSGWSGTRKNVGELAQSAPYVMSSTVTKDNFYAAHVNYVVGPLNWKGKYHLSFYLELTTSLPKDVECSLSVGMGIDPLTEVKLTASDASKGWQKVEVNDIPINSAINELSFDYYCNSNQFFEDGGKAEFWLDTVDMYEQVPPVTTPSQVCSTSAPTGTPGANLIFGGSFEDRPVGSKMVGWDWQRVTSIKDVGDLAHSSPNVLANRIDEILPFASIYVDIQPRSITAKYTISFWVRFIYTNMPENSKPTLATSVGVSEKNRHAFKTSDIEKGWTQIEIKDVEIEKFSDRLNFNFFDGNYPAKLVPGGELEYWLDDIEMYEQPTPIVTCS